MSNLTGYMTLHYYGMGSGIIASGLYNSFRQPRTHIGDSSFYNESALAYLSSLGYYVVRIIRFKVVGP